MFMRICCCYIVYKDSSDKNHRELFFWFESLSVSSLSIRSITINYDESVSPIWSWLIPPAAYCIYLTLNHLVYDRGGRYCYNQNINNILSQRVMRNIRFINTDHHTGWTINPVIWLALKKRFVRLNRIWWFVKKDFR